MGVFGGPGRPIMLGTSVNGMSGALPREADSVTSCLGQRANSAYAIAPVCSHIYSGEHKVLAGEFPAVHVGPGMAFAGRFREHPVVVVLWDVPTRRGTVVA